MTELEALARQLCAKAGFDPEGIVQACLEDVKTEAELDEMPPNADEQVWEPLWCLFRREAESILRERGN